MARNTEKRRMWCVEAEERAGSLGHSLVVLATGANNAVGKVFKKYPELLQHSRGGKVFLISHVYVNWAEGRSLVIEKARCNVNLLQAKR
jgi:hypothetical protein